MLYTPDEQDTVLEEADVPWPLPGAPLPCALATEDALLLAYYTNARRSSVPSNIPNLVSDSSMGTIAVVDFRFPAAYFSVPISNEILDAHPLTVRGLSNYKVFTVENSSWIRRLTAAQYYHDRPHPGAYSDSKHYVFVFHDSIFEAVADGVTVQSFFSSMDDARVKMLELLKSKAH
jgi:hypothetical protein